MKFVHLVLFGLVSVKAVKMRQNNVVGTTAGANTTNEYTDADYTDGANNTDEYTDADYTAGDYTTNEYTDADNAAGDHTTNEYTDADYTADANKFIQECDGQNKDGRITLDELKICSYNQGPEENRTQLQKEQDFQKIKVDFDLIKGDDNAVDANEFADFLENGHTQKPKPQPLTGEKVIEHCNSVNENQDDDDDSLTLSEGLECMENSDFSQNEIDRAKMIFKLYAGDDQKLSAGEWDAAYVHWNDKEARQEALEILSQCDSQNSAGIKDNKLSWTEVEACIKNDKYTDKMKEYKTQILELKTKKTSIKKEIKKVKGNKKELRKEKQAELDSVRAVFEKIAGMDGDNKTASAEEIQLYIREKMDSDAQSQTQEQVKA